MHRARERHGERTAGGRVTGRRVSNNGRGATAPNEGRLSVNGRGATAPNEGRVSVNGRGATVPNEGRVSVNGRGATAPNEGRVSVNGRGATVTNEGRLSVNGRNTASTGDEREHLVNRSTVAQKDERIVPMRLQRFLARAGAASRRGSENLMTAGRVRVNGVVVTELGSKVDPAVDHVTVDGREVRLAQRPTYLMLNKPAGYLTTMSDPHGRPCVASLVPTRRYPGLFPVGRLDRDTTGLLLFTTNGDAAQQMLHPSKHVTKHYVALVDGVPKPRELDRLRKGVMLDDGRAQPAQVEVLGPDDALFATVARDTSLGDASVVGLTIREGRKHQVKRMFAAVGHKVLRLHRDSFGPLSLSGCEEGSWRMLSADEVAAIERIVAG